MLFKKDLCVTRETSRNITDAIGDLLSQETRSCLLKSTHEGMRSNELKA